MTCWRLLRDWQQAGVWAALHRERLKSAGPINWSRAALDSAFVPAKGRSATGPNPTDRGKAGTKRHLVVEARSPARRVLSGASAHDGTALAATLNAPWRVPPRTPQTRPIGFAWKAMDSQKTPRSRKLTSR